MPVAPIVCGTTAIDLKSSPINPDWIRGGNPLARNALLSSSRDRSACTLVWDCTPGEFEWQYDSDETIHILEGSVILEDGCTPARCLGPGDVVLFPQGAVVRWTVETHVRKLAFFHQPLPAPVALMLRAIGKAKRIVSRGLTLGSAPRSASTAPGMGATTEAQAN